MEAVEKLLAIEEIKSLKARYFRLMDTKKWGQWEQLFTSDFTAEFPDDQPGAPPIRGNHAFAQAIEASNGPALTMHHGHMPEIEILSATTARGIWPMQDWMKWPEGSETPWGYQGLVGWGHYHETYVKTADGWRIATLKLTRLNVERY